MYVRACLNVHCTRALAVRSNEVLAQFTSQRKTPRQWDRHRINAVALTILQQKGAEDFLRRIQLNRRKQFYFGSLSLPWHALMSIDSINTFYITTKRASQWWQQYFFFSLILVCVCCFHKKQQRWKKREKSTSRQPVPFTQAYHSASITVTV